MSAPWSEITLSDVLHWRAPDTVVAAEESYCFAGVYSHGGGVFKRQPVPGSQFNYDRLSRLRTDDFVYPKLMAWEGALGIVPANCDGCFVSPEFQVFTIDRTRLLPAFFAYLVRRPPVWRDLGRLSPGTNLRRRRLQPSELLKYRIAAPPLAEQQRIVKQLSAVEVSLKRAQILGKEQQRELDAVLRSAFLKLDCYADWKPMAEVAPLAERRVCIDPDASYTEFGVRSFYKGIFLRRKVSGETFSWQEIYSLRAGDVVFSNIMAWEKGIAVASHEHEGWVGNHRMLICEPRREIVLPSYINAYFKTFEGFSKILKASPGTAARNKTLKAAALMAIQIPVPPLPQQKVFDELCRKVDKLKGAQETRAVELNALLPSLLERVFNQ